MGTQINSAQLSLPCADGQQARVAALLCILNTDYCRSSSTCRSCFQSVRPGSEMLLRCRKKCGQAGLSPASVLLGKQSASSFPCSLLELLHPQDCRVLPCFTPWTRLGATKLQTEFIPSPMHLYMDSPGCFWLLQGLRCLPTLTHEHTVMHMLTHMLLCTPRDNVAMALDSFRP